MKTRSIVAFVALALACVATVSVLHRHASRTIAATSGLGASTMASASITGRDTLSAPDGATNARSSSDALPPAPSREMIRGDARAAAHAWQSRAAAVVFAKNVAEFGVDVAHLLDLPPDQAWAPLNQRATGGDVGALLAISRIESLCRFAASEKPKTPYPPPFPGLPTGWGSFVTELRMLQRESRDERVSHCVDVGTALDSADKFIDAFLRPENPDAQVEIAAENDDAATAIADLRGIVGKNDTPRGRLLLGDRLLTSKNPDESREGRTMLEKAAENDTTAADRLAYCLQQGCDGFAGDPPAARRWIDTAAGLGDSIGIAMLYQDLDASGDVVDAWAWSLYVLDLAVDGCFESSLPLYVYIANAAANEARRRAVLTPLQQNAGLAASYAISGRWERQARERLHCAN